MEKKLFVIISILILSITAICGCIGDNSSEIEKFIGKWTSTDSDTYPYVLGRQVIFESNGIVYTGSQKIEGKFAINGNKISITDNDGFKADDRTYSFSENNTVLTIYDPTWDKTAVYNKYIVSGGSSAEEKDLTNGGHINIIEEYSPKFSFKSCF